jgi:Signal transduction histidine kinase involved in nitrogen fixation and metabolism regulation
VKTVLNLTIILLLINRQIKDIEKLVNEFSNFARMPRPVLKKINLNDVILRSINFLKISLKSKIFFKENKKKNFIMGDEDQLYRVFINIIKNAEESIIEILNKKPKYEGKIDIDIHNNIDYIVIVIRDNGEGISDTKKVMTPYFTTKKNGTGLGLPIVNKIINEHSGEFVIKKENGTKIEIWLPKI